FCGQIRHNRYADAWHLAGEVGRAFTIVAISPTAYFHSVAPVCLMPISRVAPGAERKSWLVRIRAVTAWLLHRLRPAATKNSGLCSSWLDRCAKQKDDKELSHSYLQ